jgi:hypothetical protein
MISVTAGPSRQAKLGVSSQISYTVDRIDPAGMTHLAGAVRAERGM